MKTWILKALIVLITAACGQIAVSQNYKDSEVFKRFREISQKYHEEKDFGHLRMLELRRFYNIDGTLKIYAVDTINADEVELVLEDRGRNMYAVLDTTALFSSERDGILFHKSVYLLIPEPSGTFNFIPYGEKINAFCDRYFWELLCYDDTDTTFFHSFPERLELENKEWMPYNEYFDDNARIYCNQSYLEHPIVSKPLYYMVFLIVGDSYNKYQEIKFSCIYKLPFVPVPFPDASAYYRILVPVFNECE